jgi:hypothetical protein
VETRNWYCNDQESLVERGKESQKEEEKSKKEASGR